MLALELIEKIFVRKKLVLCIIYYDPLGPRLVAHSNLLIYYESCGKRVALHGRYCVEVNGIIGKLRKRLRVYVTQS